MVHLAILTNETGIAVLKLQEGNGKPNGGLSVARNERARLILHTSEVGSPEGVPGTSRAETVIATRKDRSS